MGSGVVVGGLGGGGSVLTEKPEPRRPRAAGQVTPSPSRPVSSILLTLYSIFSLRGFSWTVFPARQMEEMSPNTPHICLRPQRLGLPGQRLKVWGSGPSLAEGGLVPGRGHQVLARGRGWTQCRCKPLSDTRP